MMNMDKMTNRLKKIEKEIKDYQDNCKHQKQSVKTIQMGDTRWVCDRCNLPLRWPTKQELDDFLSGKINWK